MAKRTKSKPLDNGFVSFDVFYEDGTRTSNRRVPSAELSGLEGEAAARRIIEEQDSAIAEKSGRPRVAIERLVRSRVVKNEVERERRAGS